MKNLHKPMDGIRYPIFSNHIASLFLFTSETTAYPMKFRPSKISDTNFESIRKIRRKSLAFKSSPIAIQSGLKDQCLRNKVNRKNVSLLKIIVTKNKQSI